MLFFYSIRIFFFHKKKLELGLDALENSESRTDDGWTDGYTAFSLSFISSFFLFPQQNQIINRDAYGYYYEFPILTNKPELIVFLDFLDESSI